MSILSDWTSSSETPSRWPLYIAGGLSLIAGLLALFSPYIATISATYLVSGLLLAYGLIMIVTAFWHERNQHMFSALVLGLVAMLGGWAIFAVPLAGVFSITILIAAYFLASGVVRLYWASTHRESRGWGWLLASGLLSVVLSLLVFFTLDETAFVLPGVLLGIDLVCAGTALLVLGRSLVDLKE